MGFAGLVAVTMGILIVVLSANGRLQNVIAAAFGQTAPGATPTSGVGSGAGNILNAGAGGGFGNIINQFWQQFGQSEVQGNSGDSNDGGFFPEQNFG